jgi:hypothetical protein
VSDLVITGDVLYPNLPPLISFQYVVSHGITPGSIILRTQEGEDEPDGIGDVVAGDGFRAFTLFDCRLDYFVSDRQGGSGVEWEMRLVDERWKWAYSVIQGWYNQLDPHAKLIPDTVRSPTELAQLCLEQMGVTRYTVDMPPGLSSLDAANQPEFLTTGVNFPIVGINPPVDWFAENAATALASLCDQCGRRLVYDPIDRTVHIVRAGVGAELPDGSLSMQQLSITAPETPDAVAIVGSPTRFQPLLKLQAVGIDWDGQIKPINALSYAPLGPATSQVTKVTVTSVDKDSIGNYPVLRVTLSQPDNPNPPKSVSAEYQVTAGDTLSNAAQSLQLTLDAAVLASTLKGMFTTVHTGAAVSITCNQPEKPFDVLISAGSSACLTQEIATIGGPGGVTWKYCDPPLFEGVRATTRLNLPQARALAQQGVFKMYRVAGVDASTGTAPMVIPGYGEVRKRQNIILLDTKVEQIVPEGGDAAFVDDDDEVLTVNLYNGYSRDQAGSVFGSVAVEIFNSLTYIGDGAAGIGQPDAAADGANTKPTDRVPISFSVDPTYQTITFSDYVYRVGAGGTIDEPDLYLQTAVNIRDEETQQLVPYTDTRVLRQGNTIMTIKRPDVQLNCYGKYEYVKARGRWRLVSTELMEIDAITRARYYLDAALIQFQLKPGVIQKYNGIIPIPMDGRVMQVTYTIRGGSGCDTTVSLNGEHDTWTPNYPARRRAENLAAVDRVVPPGARNPMDNGPGFPAARS